ncbi:aminoglycoside phosphotransferase family protein [Paenibacillus koleovorans]|uniref:aminoglycoside phosphotransferase family protein n=1 Tax=Paenibacillus koleovorans TaxID=121608 RepID=UPI000FD72ED9|nr:aminoglycoside phosphotransferase family protein [Paenibacillus koleovorans]
MIEIPPAFLQRMHELHGEAGLAWAEALPGLIAECAARFDFRSVAPFPDLTWNFILLGKDAEDRSIVLKASFLKDELAREVRVLRAYAGHGGVRVLDADESWGVAVLEGVVPGTPLSTIEDDERATAVFCEVFRRLHSQDLPVDGVFPTLLQHFAAMERYRLKRVEDKPQETPLPEKWVETAEVYLADLLASTQEPLLLLHGDLHHYNLLLRGENQWMVIDPKGVVGDVHFETIQYLLNFEDRGGDRESLLLRRIAMMADRLGLDPQRIAMWGVARGVLEACWTLEDGGADWQKGIEITERFASVLDFYQNHSKLS